MKRTNETSQPKTTAVIFVLALMSTLAGCAANSTGGDVVAVVQDEGSRQAVVEAVERTGEAETALATASEAAETPRVPESDAPPPQS